MDGYVPIDFIKSITIQDIGMYSLNAYNNTKSILEVYKLSSNLGLFESHPSINILEPNSIVYVLDSLLISEK